jgi:hypothetical protein
MAVCCWGKDLAAAADMRRRRPGWLRICRPVVTISSPMLDSEEEDGCDETSIQDSEEFVRRCSE